MLITPRLRPFIGAIDATKEITFVFDSSGGDQIFANELEIYNTSSNSKVFSNKQTTFAFRQILKLNTLSNGITYKARIRTYNNDGNVSMWSDFSVFQCLAEPTISFTDIAQNSVVKNQTYLFQGKYTQAQNDRLKSYKFVLYDYEQRQIAVSDEKFDGKLQFEFTGLMNDTNYYVEIKIKTDSNMEATTGLVKIYVKYIQPRVKNVIKLKNNVEHGRVDIEVRAIQVIFKPLYGTYKFLNDRWIDLRNGGIFTNGEWGFNLWNGDWTLDMRVKLFDTTEEFFKLFGRNEDYLIFEKWRDRVFFRYYMKENGKYILTVNIPFDISNMKDKDFVHLWIQKQGIGFRHNYDFIGEEELKNEQL